MTVSWFVIRADIAQRRAEGNAESDEEYDPGKENVIKKYLLMYFICA